MPTSKEDLTDDRAAYAPGAILCYRGAAIYRVEVVDAERNQCTLRLLFSTDGKTWRTHPDAELTFLQRHSVELPCFFTLWVLV